MVESIKRSIETIGMKLRKSRIPNTLIEPKQDLKIEKIVK